MEDHEGRLWIGYRKGQGICRYSAGAAEPIREEFCVTGSKLADVRAVIETPDGRLWLGTFDGFCEVIRGERTARCFGPETGVSGDRVLKLGLDREGNLWLGTGASGLIRLLRPGFAQFSNQEGYIPVYRPWLAELRDGTMLIAHGVGMALIEPTVRGWHPAKLIPLANTVRLRDSGALQDGQGRWHVFGGPLLFEFPPGVSPKDMAKTQPRRTTLPNSVWFYRLFEDRRGMLWASTRAAEDIGGPNGGRVMRRNPSGKLQDIPEVAAALAKLEREHSTGARVAALADDGKGSVWMGLATNQLVYERHTALLLRHQDGRLTEFSQTDGLPGGNVNALHVDQRGWLWLATQAGLARTDNPGAQHPRFISYGPKQGLSSDEVWSLTEDNAGRIYAGTAKGVDRLEVSSGEVRHFTSADGLAPGAVVAAMRCRDGSLWFGTETALFRFEPEEQTTAPASTFLVSPANGFEVPHHRNYFEAQFSSPAFGGGPLRFQYRLSGQDWGPPVSESIVRYASMGPGDYVLQARAVTASGLVSPQPVSLRFTVLPPLWLTWWFLSLALAGVLALLYALHRYRVTQLLALERVRTRIASDLHDDIGSTLSQVSMLGELARRSLNGQHPAATDLIDRMSAASREAVAAMSDIVWSIHPSHDRASDLAQRMRSFASDLLSARDIDFDFRLSEGVVPTALEPEVRRDLLLVFKESVHNAARHAGCRLVRADLNIDGREAVLTVEDDGGGIGVKGQGSSGNGHGLVNMRARAEKAGGSLAVEPRAGSSGTRVTCRLPLVPRRRGSETNMRQR